MRCYDNGSTVIVQVFAREVEDLADQWPCSHLKFAPLTCEFEKSNGDLVDINDQSHHPEADGSAVGALVEDAKAYAVKRGKLNGPKTPAPVEARS